MIERLLRWSAVTIAVAGVVDPAFTFADRTRPRVSVTVQTGPSMDLPAAGDQTRRAEAIRVLATLRRDLESQFELVEGSDRTAAAAIVVGDRYPEEPPPVSQPTSTITVATPIAPNVRIVDVDAPRAVPAETTVRLGVGLEAVGVRGLASTVVVRAAGAEVARASHTWTADRERWRAALEVVPIGPAPFVFEIAVEPLARERTDADNRAIVSVAESPMLRVLAFDARPSWASAFVRRALESDRRLRVSGLSDVSPHASVRSGESPALPGDGLDAFDAIVVGGLDRLSPADAKTLFRFMTERGGSVALVPDTRLAGAAVQMLVGVVAARETLLGTAPSLAGVAGLPRIDASELLEFTDLPLRATVLARRGGEGDPVVWTAPRGSGRLLVSGAMDAWRYRAERGVEFDRFWRSAVSGLALAARPAVEVELTPQRIAAGDRVHVVARVRGIETVRLGDTLAVSARTGPMDRVQAPGDPDAPLRLWPTAARGVFEGWFDAPPAPVRVDVTVGDTLAWGTAMAVIDNAAREADGPPLSLLASTRAGVDVVPRDLASLEHHLRTTVPGQPALAVRHPMRSALWIWPFAASLSAEWWLRRRRGFR